MYPGGGNQFPNGPRNQYPSGGSRKVVATQGVAISNDCTVPLLQNQFGSSSNAGLNPTAAAATATSTGNLGISSSSLGSVSVSTPQSSRRDGSSNFNSNYNPAILGVSSGSLASQSTSATPIMVSQSAKARLGHVRDKLEELEDPFGITDVEEEWIRREMQLQQQEEMNRLSNKSKEEGKSAEHLFARDSRREDSRTPSPPRMRAHSSPPTVFGPESTVFGGRRLDDYYDPDNPLTPGLSVLTPAGRNILTPINNRAYSPGPGHSYRNPYGATTFLENSKQSITEPESSPVARSQILSAKELEVAEQPTSAGTVVHKYNARGLPVNVAFDGFLKDAGLPHSRIKHFGNLFLSKALAGARQAFSSGDKDSNRNRKDTTVQHVTGQKQQSVSEVCGQPVSSVSSQPVLVAHSAAAQVAQALGSVGNVEEGNYEEEEDPNAEEEDAKNSMVASSVKRCGRHVCARTKKYLGCALGWKAIILGSLFFGRGHIVGMVSHAAEATFGARSSGSDAHKASGHLVTPSHRASSSSVGDGGSNSQSTASKPSNLWSNSDSLIVVPTVHHYSHGLSPVTGPVGIGRRLTDTTSDTVITAQFEVGKKQLDLVLDMQGNNGVWIKCAKAALDNAGFDSDSVFRPFSLRKPRFPYPIMIPPGAHSDLFPNVDWKDAGEGFYCTESLKDLGESLKDSAGSGSGGRSVDLRSVNLIEKFTKKREGAVITRKHGNSDIDMKIVENSLENGEEREHLTCFEHLQLGSLSLPEVEMEMVMMGEEESTIQDGGSVPDAALLAEAGAIGLNDQKFLDILVKAVGGGESSHGGNSISQKHGDISSMLGFSFEVPDLSVPGEVPTPFSEKNGVSESKMASGKFKVGTVEALFGVDSGNGARVDIKDLNFVPVIDTVYGDNSDSPDSIDSPWIISIDSITVGMTEVKLTEKGIEEVKSEKDAESDDGSRNLQADSSSQQSGSKQAHTNAETVLEKVMKLQNAGTHGSSSKELFYYPCHHPVSNRLGVNASSNPELYENCQVLAIPFPRSSDVYSSSSALSADSVSDSISNPTVDQTLDSVLESLHRSTSSNSGYPSTQSETIPKDSEKSSSEKSGRFLSIMFPQHKTPADPCDWKGETHEGGANSVHMDSPRRTVFDKIADSVGGAMYNGMLFVGEALMETASPIHKDMVINGHSDIYNGSNLTWGGNLNFTRHAALRNTPFNVSERGKFDLLDGRFGKRRPGSSSQGPYLNPQNGGGQTVCIEIMDGKETRSWIADSEGRKVKDLVVEDHHVVTDRAVTNHVVTDRVVTSQDVVTDEGDTTRYVPKDVVIDEGDVYADGLNEKSKSQWNEDHDGSFDSGPGAESRKMNARDMWIEEVPSSGDAVGKQKSESTNEIADGITNTVSRVSIMRDDIEDNANGRNFDRRLWGLRKQDFGGRKYVANLNIERPHIELPMEILAVAEKQFRAKNRRGMQSFVADDDDRIPISDDDRIPISDDDTGYHHDISAIFSKTERENEFLARQSQSRQNNADSHVMNGVQNAQNKVKGMDVNDDDDGVTIGEDYDDSQHDDDDAGIESNPLENPQSTEAITSDFWCRSVRSTPNYYSISAIPTGLYLPTFTFRIKGHDYKIGPATYCIIGGHGIIGNKWNGGISPVINRRVDRTFNDVNNVITLGEAFHRAVGKLTHGKGVVYKFQEPRQVVLGKTGEES